MDIFIKSFASALVTALILVLAKYSGPKLAGALGGIPIVFAVSYVFVTMKTKDSSNEFLMGGVYGAIAAIFFSFLLIWLNTQFPNFLWVNFVAAYVLCFCFAFLMVLFTSK